MFVSKISNFTFRVKHKTNNYINENSDEIGFKLIEKCLVNRYCVVSDSYQSFMIYNKHIKRVIIVWIYYILLCYCLFVNHSLCSNNQSLFRFRFRVSNY